MSLLKKIPLLLLITLLMACDDDDELTGNVVLVVSREDIEGLEIDVYPEGVYTISELIRTQPIMRNLEPNLNGEVMISNLNAGNYTWHGGRENIGFFQVSAGQTKRYEIFIR